MKDDLYSITILNPKVSDMGKYTLVVKDGKETYHTGAYLDVKGKLLFEMDINGLQIIIRNTTMKLIFDDIHSVLF